MGILQKLGEYFLTSPQNNVISGPEPSGVLTVGPNVYSGSSISNTSSDFLGDWRALDSWMRQDLYRTRGRSRQLQRGNPFCIAYGRNLRDNVLGSEGFHMKVNAVMMEEFGDANPGTPDKIANQLIKAALEKFGGKMSFTTRRQQTRADVDKLVVTKLAFDGEVIFRKRRGYTRNDYGFAWQLIDPDYLDHNLNRVEPNGNIIKMGVELDGVDKFPVAYWFLHRRPNDYFYNYTDISQQQYYRVPAEEVIHFFVQTDDSEQTRGFPWIFAGMINLFRAEKFTEAALINAAIGASKPFFYEKDYPEGFDGNPKELDDDGYLIDKVAPGSAVELPYGVKATTVDTRYPDAELQPFMQAMGLAMHLTFGTSYASTTGDLSQANFVSSKLGMGAEQETYKSIQKFVIDHWKIPGYDEELYRLMLAGKINLPISKFEKYNQPVFTGRRWSGLQPLEEAKANETNLNNRLTSVSMILESQGKDPDEVFRQIAEDEEKWETLGIGPRLTNTPSATVADAPVDGKETEMKDEPPKPAQKKPRTKKK